MSPAANRPRRGASPLAMRVGLGLGFLLAMAATVLVVFTEQVQWLRLAVVLGLWAALIAAFAVAWFRRAARNADLRAEDSKRTYELELHREISARREYEIGVAEAAREDAEARHREELAGLREQLDRLNNTLSGLLEGDLLFERLTLSAESTRVRQVGDGGRNRLVGAGRAAQIETVAEAVGPFVGRQSAAPSALQTGQPQQGEAPAGGPFREHEDDTIQFQRPDYSVRPGSNAPQAGPTVQSSSTVQAPGAGRAPFDPRQQTDPRSAPAASAAWPHAPADTIDVPATPAPVMQEPAVQEPPAQEPEPQEPEPQEPAAQEPEPQEPGVEPAPVEVPELEAEPVTESETESESEPEPVAVHQPEVVVEPDTVVEPEAEPVAVVEPDLSQEPDVPAEPEMVAERATADEPRTSGGHERAEADDVADPGGLPSAVADESDSGRRSSHRAGDTPAISEEPNDAIVDAAEPPDEQEPALAGTGHSSGISVADLLAAYGANDSAPRRRRRAQD